MDLDDCRRRGLRCGLLATWLIMFGPTVIQPSMDSLGGGESGGLSWFLSILGGSCSWWVRELFFILKVCHGSVGTLMELIQFLWNSSFSCPPCLPVDHIQHFNHVHRGHGNHNVKTRTQPQVTHSWVLGLIQYDFTLPGLPTRN